MATIADATHLPLGRMLDAFPSAAKEVLQGSMRSAGRSGTRLFLVGGSVRDWLLGRASGIRDLDLAVEGDGYGFAVKLALDIGLDLRSSHPQFGTAVLGAPGSLRVD